MFRRSDTLGRKHRDWVPGFHLIPGNRNSDSCCGSAATAETVSRQVGEEGKVIGVDMTPEMIAKARENARKGGFQNVEFRPGEIEHLPAALRFFLDS
jgi:arsenite methyltransferase